MSIERCRRHDRNYDTDFVECCPDCERAGDMEADVALAESMFALPVVQDTHDERLAHVDLVMS